MSLLIPGNAQVMVTHTVYIAVLGSKYAQASNKPTSEIMPIFSGISFTFFCFNSVWGNLVSSLVFGDYFASTTITENATALGQLCGVHFCPGKSKGTEIEEPNRDTVNIVIASFIGMLFVSFSIVLFFVDDIKASNRDTVTNLKDYWMTLGRTLTSYKLYLFLPVACFMAMEKSFIQAEFTEV